MNEASSEALKKNDPTGPEAIGVLAGMGRRFLAFCVQAAGIPKAQRGFQQKTDLALAMIRYARQQGIGFAWVGFDGFYLTLAHLLP